MEKNGMNLFLYASAFSVNLLSFCTGSGYSWTSPVLPKLGSNDSTVNPLPAPTTTFEESWLTSLLSLGAAMAPFMSGPVSKRIGCKKTLLLFSVPILISQLLYAIGTHIIFFLIGRFIQGIGLGCVFSVLPGYVGEISEDSNRGLLGCIMGVSVTCGALFSYTIGPFVSVRVFSFISMLPLALCYGTFGIFVPESPYYYVSIKDNINAEKSLRKLRNTSDNAVKKEVLYITEIVEKTKDDLNSIREIFKCKALIKGLLIGGGLMVFQQLSGFCAVQANMQSIFESTGSSIPPHISVIIVGTIQLVANIFTTSLVDRLGRKILLLLSAAGIFFSLAALGTYFYLENIGVNMDSIFWFPVLILMLYIVTFNIGFNSLPWTIMGELFSSNVKAMATSITSCICLSSSFLVMMIFPYLSISVGMAGSFWIFSGFCAIAIVFIIFIVPETKGKSFLDIQMLLSDGKNRK